MHQSHGSCSKFILLGEHSVIHKGVALSIPLPSLRLSVEILQDSQDLYFNGFKQHPDKRRDLESLCEHLEITIPKTLGLNIVSEIPIGAGLGSSAALCCALLRQFSEKPLKGQELAQRAMRGENFFHGKSSGVDPFTIALEHPIVFNSESLSYELLSLAPLYNQGLGFVIVDTQRPHSTKEIIETTKALRESQPQVWQGCIDTLAKIAEQGREAVDRGDAENLGNLINQAHETLKCYGVSNTSLDELTQGMRAQGALGAKLTGAGKGGCALALLPRSKLNSFRDYFSKMRTFSLFE